MVGLQPVRHARGQVRRAAHARLARGAGAQRDDVVGADLVRRDVDAAAVLVEADLAVGQGEERPITAYADVGARNEPGTALADDDLAHHHFLAVIQLHAEALCDRIAS